MPRPLQIPLLVCALLSNVVGLAPLAEGQTLDEALQRVPLAELARSARTEGDPARGAVVFFQPYMACSKCHVFGTARANALGPDLTALGKDATDEALVESVLWPSRVVRKGFESVTVITSDGKSLTALLVERTQDRVALRDVSRGGEITTIPAAEIESLAQNSASIMPAAQVNQLQSRQQFLDLIRYLMEIRDGGSARALQLQPSASLLTFAVPEYEKHLDHAGLIGGWNDDSLRRGEAIYQRVCANCHGTREKLGSLPTSLRFAEGKFKNGSDPLSMYRTLTHGFGLMAPQAWMVPSQKYDVIQYIREIYLRPHNPSQFVPVDGAYLARLPQGNTRGPEPSKIEPWSAMDYGPALTHTYEVPGERANLAYKGVAVRLDSGSGGVSRGRHWMLYDTDTLRLAAAWSSASEEANFIDWRGIQFNGEHQIHPHLVGRIEYTNSLGPGWANPAGSFRDDRRVEGRDGRRYGPLPRDWARFRGLYHHGQRVIFSYTVGSTSVLELPRVLGGDEVPGGPVFLRSLEIGPRERDLVLQVAEPPAADAQATVDVGRDRSVVRLEPGKAAAALLGEKPEKPLVFDGGTYAEVREAADFDLTTKDFSITARVKTTVGGTILALAQPGQKWVPNGQTFFIRNGRLGFDIGWVGVVAGKTKLDDGKWHDIAVTRSQSTRHVCLYVDGRLDARGELSAKAPLAKGVVRIGFTAPDFPRPNTFFRGELAEVAFHQRCVATAPGEPTQPRQNGQTPPLARWTFGGQRATRVADATGNKHDAMVVHADRPEAAASRSLLAGFSPSNIPASWMAEKGQLRLRIPAGKERLRLTLWTLANAQPDSPAKNLGEIVPEPDLDLTALTQGGPARWPQNLETHAQIGRDDVPFAVDVLTAPESNPWLAQTRFTGLDFFPDGRWAVCSWDGDVWTIQPQGGTHKLAWRRIASGLFQPLGLKIVDGTIHVICRDQLAALHDLNGDGETDYYECVNNDHQVTEHFHEFAMGLQTDAAGNFYYAKSGRHALPAVVPHHGTLLRVARDGSQTEILATGFRAANGVCLNTDGSFFVTDQEGFWNPKNRINWVTLAPAGKPKFYGNLFGYTDVTDPSDAAMEPPLCWITNEFDRSPAELLWVDSDRWGPLAGTLLNLSYGNGKVFLVPHERVGDQMQGGMIELPVPAFPTGIMRGRFHPHDRHLYVCGMFAWAGSATQPGGLFRIRATGLPCYLPVGLNATRSGIALTFSEPLDPTAVQPENIAIKIWSLKRTANYGSQHHRERRLAIERTTLSADGKRLTIVAADLVPTWCMEIKYALRAADGKPVNGTIHNTIHALPESKP